MRSRNIIQLFVFLLISVTAYSQEVKKVAILETVDAAGDVPLGVEISVRSKITFAITEMPDYEAYDRINLSEIFGEHDFQRSGNVSDEQIKRMGEMYGVDYILISEVAYMDMEKQNLILASRIIDVETTKIAQTASVETKTDANQISEACRTLARRLLIGGSSSHSAQSGYSGSASDSSYKNETGNYTENARNLNMNMIYVEGGTFTMGATAEQDGAADNEYLIHTVHLDGFYMSQCEITQAQWKAVMGTSVYNLDPFSGISGLGDTYPMYNVSWKDAMAFCRELSRLTGKTYLLPTEAQWEYAARGGNKSRGNKYSGSYAVDAVAWYSENSNNSAHPVGELRPNELGLYDMSGNVVEWCSDWYSSSYSSAEQTNPTGPSSGEYRLLRGGSWLGPSGFCRVSFRSYHSPSDRSTQFGFRVVCLP